MSAHRRLFICVLGVSVWQAGRVAADISPGGQRDLAMEVREVFAAKCTVCHGSNLPRPRGRFGYVLELARVASNPEMVVPFSPSESELWERVQRDEMPPADAPTGPLTVGQKEVIRAWIAEGAPLAAPSAPSVVPSDAQPAEEVAAGPMLTPPGQHFLQWLGKFHLVLLHFPIALLAVAAAGEFWSVLRQSRVPGSAARFAILLGAASAVATVALGWLLALSGYGAGMPGTLNLHRWLGTATGLCAAGAAIVVEREARHGGRNWAARLLMFLTALLVGLTGHSGGLLVHGVDFFDW